MDNSPRIGQLMLKRTGVGGVIQVPRTEEYNGVIFGDAQIATCVNIQRADIVKKHADWSKVDESGYWDFNLNTMFRNLGYRVCKALNVQVWHIDIIVDRDSNGRIKKDYNGQTKKYPNYFSSQKKGKINYKEVKYE